MPDRAAVFVDAPRVSPRTTMADDIRAELGRLVRELTRESPDELEDAAPSERLPPDAD